MWPIFHLTIIMLMRWLAGKTHKLAHRKWGYISMGKVMDNLKENLQSIVNTTEIIHDQDFMMGMLTVCEEKLPELKYYRHDVIEKNRTGYFNDTTKEKAFPLKELLKELFTLVDQDKKYINPILENLAVVAVGRWITELLDPTKVTYMLMSEYGGAYSWDVASDELKKSLFGLMAVKILRRVRLED